MMKRMKCNFLGEIRMDPAKLFFNLINGKHNNALRLLQEGVDINGIYFEEEGTILNKAISSSKNHVVRFLLEHGANPNIIYGANNSLGYLNNTNELDVYILEQLIEAGVLLLPMQAYPDQTIVHFFDLEEFAIEKALTEKEEELEHYKETNNPDEEKIDSYNDEILSLETALDATRKIIAMLRPVEESTVVKLQIELTGTPTVFRIAIDKRATVKLLKDILRAFYLGFDILFQLVYPTFHLEEKRVMEDERALSDYNVQTDTKLAIVLQMSSGLKKNGGKRKTRKMRKQRRTRKN